MEVELFKLKGLQFDPDMVILAYYINDVESTPKTKNRFTFNIIKRSRLLAVLFDRYVKTKTRFIKGFNWKDYYAKLYLEDTGDLAKNRKALSKLVELCKIKGIRLLFVNIPELRVLNDYPFQYATDYIKTVAENSNIAFLDLLPELAVHEPESLWVSSEDPHANSKANSIIAAAIYKKLISEGLISNQK